MATSATPAVQALRHAWAAQQRGDLVAAEAGYREVLGLDPEEPDALQLLGLLLKRRGVLDEAERCWRRSLAARPGQPHVLNNLANLLERQGRLTEAESMLREALRHKGDYADAHYNLARVLHRGGALDAADQSLAQAVRAAGGRPSVGMRHLRAQIAMDRDRLDEALAEVDAALAEAPAQAALHHTRANVLHRQGRDVDALAAHDQAASLGLGDADARYNRGNVLQTLGRHDEALQSYRAALALDPTHALALYDLARLRWRLGDAQPDAELIEATRNHPGSAVAPAVHGHLLWRAGRPAEAAQAYREALWRSADDPRLHDGLARCLVRCGALEEGLSHHRQALALAPERADLRIHHATSLLEAGAVGEALAEAEAASARAPDDQHALALRGVAWRLLGDPREAWLNDEARLVRTFDLPAPAGWATMGDFLSELADELKALHRDRREPVDQTLRTGTQTTGTLFDQPHARVQALRQLLVQAIDTYVRDLPDDSAHPFLARRAPRWRFTDSWSSRLKAQGHHIDHVHPHGWISAVVYVEVPPACADAARREGWLRFGQPDLDLSRLGVGPLARRMEAPRPGRLVVFPSMFWHGTTPFQDAQDRLTVAFDVVPLPR